VPSSARGVRRPTRRCVALAGAAVVLFGAGTVAQAGWLFVLAAALMGTVVGAAFAPHGLDGCRVERTLPRRVAAGETALVRLTLENRGRRPVALVRLHDEHRALEPVTVVCDGLGPGGRAVAEVTARAPRRGVYEGGRVALTCAWPFGLWTSRRILDVPAPLRVTPAWVPLRSFGLQPAPALSAETVVPLVRAGAGHDPYGVREYREGDPVRAVHWRSTARAGRLVVREHEDDARRRVALVLGGPDAGTPPGSAFEALVQACASIAQYAADHGCETTLLHARAHGAPATLAGAGRSATLEWLAGVEAEDASLLPATRAAARLAGRAGTVVLLTASAGHAASELPAAVRVARAGGAHPIAVIAAADTWDPHRRGPDPTSAAAGAVLLRLGRADDLRTCLES
jgi:uncharacterized protein (DUF58 family)